MYLIQFLTYYHRKMLLSMQKVVEFWGRVVCAVQ